MRPIPRPTRFLREQRGSVAIETVFILPLFLMCILSIFEVGHMYYKSSNIEQEMSNLAREVKVGQAFTASFVSPDADPSCPFGSDYPAGHALAGQPCPCETGQECFFERACERLSPYLHGPCQDQLSVEVRRYASFAMVPSTISASCPSAAGYTFNGTGYDPGQANDIVQLIACFELRTFGPYQGAVNLATNGSSTREIVSVQLHRNEPYDPT